MFLAVFNIYLYIFIFIHQIFDSKYEKAKAQEKKAANNTQPCDKYIKSYRMQNHTLSTHVKYCQTQNKQSQHKGQQNNNDVFVKYSDYSYYFNTICIFPNGYLTAESF